MSPLYCCLVAVLCLPWASASPVATASISVSAVQAPVEPTPVQFLRVHNEARAAVGVAPLSWNGTLQLDAARYAGELRRDCSLRPPPPTAQRGTGDGAPVYGRNLFKAYGRRHTGAEVAAFWADGRRWYDHDAGRCAAPPGLTCGAYTQVVWRATTQLGCAHRTCRNGVDTVAVCDYYPPGNIVGQRPY